jgi:hypothetical protein
MRLNQIIAIANGEKSRKEKILSLTYQKLQKHELFVGMTRTYRPLEESEHGITERLPNEKRLVQMTIQDAIKDTVKVLKDTFNTIATQDIGNQKATANVIIDGDVLLENVPATNLIFLEKQLIDLNTFVSKFPTLDPAEDWTYSEDSGCYKTDVKETARTKKVSKSIVKYEATKEHPAQTEMITEDKIVGYWEAIFLSGAIRKEDKNKILDRILQLSKAVKIAREEANNTEVKMSTIGDGVLDYIFNGE